MAHYSVKARFRCLKGECNQKEITGDLGFTHTFETQGEEVPSEVQPGVIEHFRRHQVDLDVVQFVAFGVGKEKGYSFGIITICLPEHARRESVFLTVDKGLLTHVTNITLVAEGKNIQTRHDRSWRR